MPSRLNAAFPTSILPLRWALTAALVVACSSPSLLSVACAADGGEAPQAGMSATMAVKGNVRYGPSTKAKAVCSLDAGEPLEVIGKAEVPDWFVVRFPQKGQAWVHGKNLQAVDGGKRWKVISDGTKARDDATLKGAIVAELSVGEVIDDRNRAVGDWHAVYIPSAIAYAHKSVLNLPSADAIKQQQDRADKAQATWESAQSRYRQLYKKLQDNPEAALDLDSSLFDQLEVVIKDHADAAVRLSAQRIKDGVTKVIETCKALRDSRNATPQHPATTSGGTTGGAVATTGGTTGGTVAKTTGGATTGGTTTTATPAATTSGGTGGGTGELAVPDDAHTPAATPTNPTPKLPTPVANSGAFAAVGFVSENSEYPKVSATNLLLDGNSKVVAFLSVKTGATVNLAEYYWRWVGVTGDVQDLDQALHGMGTKIPLIIVDGVALVKK